jgi:ubiquinone/menaquinone biosynthesis C-methylase UbiE
MESLPYADNTFDVVIADQVIEHIEGDVQRAIDEARRVLKKGGIAVIATAFIQPIHWGPKDLWRFSPDALRYLCRDFFEIITCEGWGNRWAHALFFLYPKSRTWQIPEQTWSIRRFLATMNDDCYPQVTWIIAKK